MSIIVTVYNRRNFVLDALRSALNQTVSRDKYEIIVVKNYVDQNIDEFLTNNNIIQVYATQKNQVTFTMEGLKIAKGEIIIFLEDDDRFLPTKVEQVILKFTQRPNLIYLHNNFREIDESGAKRNRRILKQAGKEIVINTNNPKQRNNTNLFHYFAFYNTSCISVRREPFMQLFARFSELLEPPTDLNFYILCLLSGYEIMFTNALLNEYMVHFQSRTFGNLDTTRAHIEEIEKYRKIYRNIANNHASTFGFPLLMSQALELTFQEYVLDSANFKPSFSELLAFSYYSLKRRNRFYLVLIILRYINIITHETLLSLIAKRRKIRLNEG